MKNSIQVENLSASYDNNLAIWGVNTHIHGGEITSLIGPNGAGKSTLIKAMLQLIPKKSGHVLFYNQDSQVTQIPRKKIAYMPQREHIDWNFPISVEGVVEMGLYPKLKFFKKITTSEKDIIDSCLKKVQMEDFRKRAISELSGGQQKRVFLARALAQEADYLFLDEPFSGIDKGSEEILLTQLQELKKKHKVIFIIHHDLFSVWRHSDKIILLNKRIVAHDTGEEILKSGLLEEVYGSDSCEMIELLRKVKRIHDR